MIMSFLWGGSKPSKVEGIALDEIKWLQTSLQQGMGYVDLLESNSEALKSAVESQTYTTQKLQQEWRSCNLKNVLTNKGTQTEETSNSEDIGCSGDAGSWERFPDEDHQSSDMHDENTESAVDPPPKQQDLQEYPDNILVKLLVNNQTVLMNQAIVNQKAVQNSTQWLQNLQQQVGTWFSENFESSLNEQEKKYKSLEDEKNQLSKTCKDLEEEKNRLIKNCKEHQLEKDQLSKKCKKLEEENTQLIKKCKELEEGKKEIERLKKDNDRLSSEINYMKNPAMTSSYSGRYRYSSYNPVQQNKPVTTQVYCPRKSELTTNVVSELSSTLQLQMLSWNLELVMQMCDMPSQISRSLPVIVICLNASRLGTDVSSALQGVPAGPNVAVLIFHHKDLHALPSQSSDRVLTGPEYKHVGAIIDMAYLTTKGMYSCEMNNKALETLIEFIKTHSHL
ncbi:hypothetical protein ACJMK2_037088 [Sinanodonta woodiana]|uniref:Uncharacterized protein n=1 Tax=Sinanodonta woodiana TaxID=1069815 RepID=A0ABD3WJ86_SINWO